MFALDFYGKGHQYCATAHQVARKDHVGRPRAS